LLAPSARATPRPLPFTYPVQTLPQGTLEVEQYVDLTPVRVAREEAAGTEAVTSLRSVLQTELEYGLTDRLELGFYFVFRQAASATSPYLQFQGLKQRLRYELSERAVWPIEVGLYGEVAEFHDEFEFEEKILLQRRMGAWNFGVNLWVEQEYYFQTGDWRFIYNPTAGVSYEISPKFSLGAEYWLRGRFDDDDASQPAGLPGVNTETPSGSTARHYLGPTFMVQSAEYFLSLGAYARMDGLTDEAVVGDAWGKLWVRTLIGVHL